MTTNIMNGSMYRYNNIYDGTLKLQGQHRFDECVAFNNLLDKNKGVDIVFISGGARGVIIHLYNEDIENNHLLNTYEYGFLVD